MRGDEEKCQLKAFNSLDFVTSKEDLACPPRFQYFARDNAACRKGTE